MFDACVGVHSQPSGNQFNRWVTPARRTMATRNGARAFGPTGVLAAESWLTSFCCGATAPAYRPLQGSHQIVFAKTAQRDTVIVNGELFGGRLTKVDEEEVLRLAEQSRARLEPSMQRELAAAKTMEPALAEMYFRVFGG
jgi:hypothetical protein